MTHATVAAPAAADLPPLDLTTFRETALPLLDDTAVQPAGEDLARQTVLLRDHIAQLIDEVAAACTALPERAADSVYARAAISEAQMHLRLGDGGSPLIRRSVAVKLARSVRTLCGHYERLTAPPAP